MLKVLVFILQVASAQAQEPQPAVSQTQAGQKVAVEKKEAKPEKTVKDDEAKGGDTYNFYFQKGPGPSTVEQGGGSQKVENGNSSTSQPPPAPKEPEVWKVPALEAQAGLIEMLNLRGSGYTVGAQFNFTDSFGIQLHALGMKFSDDTGDTNFSAEGSSTSITASSATGVSAAATITPFTINGNGVKTRLSALAGAMWLSSTVDVTTSTFGAGGSNDFTNSYTQSKVLGFAGAGVTSYITKQIAVGGDLKVTSDPKYSQVAITGAWLFKEIEK